MIRQFVGVVMYSPSPTLKVRHHLFVANTHEFGSGNPFSAGRAAMALGQRSYTCCLTDLADKKLEFQLGILPTDEGGKVNGRVSELSFYIWKGSAHPEQAFKVLAYILQTGSEKLLPAYAAMPPIINQNEQFISGKTAVYPQVTAESWQVFVDSLAYYDRPSAEQYLPNRNEAVNRLQIFGDVLVSTADLDFEAEFQKLQQDLTLIYNR